MGHEVRKDLLCIASVLVCLDDLHLLECLEVCREHGKDKVHLEFEHLDFIGTGWNRVARIKNLVDMLGIGRSDAMSPEFIPFSILLEVGEGTGIMFDAHRKVGNIT